MRSEASQEEVQSAESVAAHGHVRVMLLPKANNQDWDVPPLY